MRIGIDATTWDLPRGFGRYARCLLTALAEVNEQHELILFTDTAQTETPFPEGTSVLRVGTSRKTIEAASHGGRRSVLDMLRLGRAMSCQDLDVLFFPSSFSFVPVWTRARTFVVFHDVTGFLYPQFAFGNWQSHLLWTLKTYLARLQADRILTVSDHSRDGLAKHFRLHESEIEVITEAAHPAFFRHDTPTLTPHLESRGLRADRRYLVYLGGFGPLKNLDRLVEAFAGISDRPGVADVDLVLVGHYKKESFYSTADQLIDRVEELGLAHRVVFTGFLSDHEVCDLLNVATAAVLVSLNEGFGLPALEAAACGCPSVATTSSPLPQLLGGGGLYVDPYSVTEIAEALLSILTDRELRDSMAQAAQESAGRLSWEESARRLLKLLEG